MRVITGQAKGMRLATLDGLETRPTTARIKESIFNIIQFDIEGRSVLDLFGGSGQLGIEALSRGAGSAVFVDSSLEAVRLIEENLRKTKLSDSARVVHGDAVSHLRSFGEKFDLIFIDPPYNGKLLNKSLQEISEIDILTIDGIMVVERAGKVDLPPLDEGRFSLRSYMYGKSGITIITRI